VPDGYQYNRTNQRPEDGNASHYKIANTADNDDLCHQPGANETRDDRPDDAKWEPPADEEFRDQPDNCPNEEIHDKIGSKSKGSIAKPDGDAVRENSAVDEEMEHVILLERHVIDLKTELAT